MDIDIGGPNKPEDYLVNQKYNNMINAKHRYSIDDFEKAKKVLELLSKNYSEKEEYIHIKERYDLCVKIFDEIIKEKIKLLEIENSKVHEKNANFIHDIPKEIKQ